jgi:hypothetical protein
MYTYVKSGTGTNNMKLYINGVLDLAFTNTTTITDTASFYIGYTQNYSTYFPGKVSLVGLYTRALSEAEVTQNYSATSYRY